MATYTQIEEDPLVQPKRPTKDGSSASPRNKDSEESSSEEEHEGEQVRLLTTDGRPSRELQQILQDVEEFVGAPKQGKRIIKQPDRYQALVAQVGEPSSFREAAQRRVWVDAMVEEYSSIMKNDVWEIVPRPQDRLVVGSRWIYKIKYAADGSIEKFKARFVAKGYAQNEGINYEETFAPIARYTSIRSVISLAA